MRVGYLEMGLGLAVTKWRKLIARHGHWPLYEGVTTYLLVAMGVLALIGLRHPSKMLPILVFESTWKPAWLAAVACPCGSIINWTPRQRKWRAPACYTSWCSPSLRGGKCSTST